MTTTVPAIAWRAATIREVREETASVRTLLLDVPGWQGHVPGQHVDVRLVSGTTDGAVRTFSIASAPEDPWIALTIERLPGGKVSSRLCGDVYPGSRFELRGPMGRSFVWRASDGGPLLLVAGGSGIAPLMSMLRHRAHASATSAPGFDMLGGARVLYSTRTPEDIIYREELAALVRSDPSVEITYTATRGTSADWPGFRRRIDRAMLEQVAWPTTARSRTYVSGPSAFVETVTGHLLALGHERASIFTEGFGPSSGASMVRHKLTSGSDPPPSRSGFAGEEPDTRFRRKQASRNRVRT